MEYIYICPKCGAVYGRAERTSRACSSCGTALVDSDYTSDVWDGLPPRRKAEIVKEFFDGEVKQDNSMQAETRGDWLYSCHTKLAVIGSKYSSTVYAYSDRVEIHREGKTALPKDMTLFFDDITVISGGNSSGRSWISFSVPGMFNAGRGVVTAAKPGQIVIAGPTIPYDDPCTVMYGLGEKREAEEDCRQINEIFMTYKAESRKRKEVGAPSIMQESALDQLKKLKELFDMGVITEAEYNEKREKRMKDI